MVRSEFEYEIPVDDADEMLEKLCQKPLLEKTRYCVQHGGLTWEVDVFSGHAEGLVIAEVELDRVDQSVVIPDWVSTEVTDDLRYRTAAIAAMGIPTAASFAGR
jgi:CYTH domain-containing protein